MVERAVLSSNRTTLRGSPVVAAPGKVFLIGEYAVLEEGSAVLAAVSRLAVAQFVPDLEAASPLITECCRRATVAMGEFAAALPPGSVLVDSSQFERDGHKLGLGSSAATAVAAVGALFENAGLSITDNRDLLQSVADAAHRTAQGGLGSGADVAVAVNGGFVHFLRPKDGYPAVVKMRPPADLQIVVFWTGQPARTTEMITAVQDFAARTPPLYRWIIDEMRATADRFVKDFGSNHTRGVIAAAEAYFRALTELGSSAGVPIVTPAFSEAAALAKSLSGAAKPSGAGGGDVGVAFFANPGAAAEFGKRCPPGISVLDLAIDEAGVRRRLPGAIEVTR